MADRHYLSGLDLADKRVVVVGGGTVAQRRLPRLVDAGARVELISPEITPGVQSMVDRDEILWQQRLYAADDLDGAWYVVVATSDREVNAEVTRDAYERRIFCVRSDAGAEGSAVTPASGEHDGMMLGVLAGGEHRRSASVRDGLLDALRAGTVSDRESPEHHRGQVVLVGGGPGDPDLITVAGRRALTRADVVVVDRLAPRELLDDLPPTVEIVDATKIPYGRSASQDVINAALIDNAKAGKSVVRLKGGDSYLFGRGFEEVLACAEHDIPVTVVPGITSAFAAPAVAGVPVTHRGVAHEVVVVSGHVAPDDPTSLTDWSALAKLRGTVVLLMGMQRLHLFAEALIEGGRPADTPVAVIADGTMSSQRVLRSTVDKVAEDVAAQGFKPPAIVVFGPVAALGDAVRGE
jgi:uroporphyrin-III C-methyltransferase/precorrin-2 dehydrogenase/sirohydrochlorin ferrochelatase